MAKNKFTLKQTDTETQARLGQLRTAHGPVNTPIFMPVGTRATVKTCSPRDLIELNAEIILGNTYHLYLRPGHRIVQQAGGLHKFMGWKKPILTDSGGFQVFSLGSSRTITELGVEFKSEIDGQKHMITPERSIEIQNALGADIIMNFDECPAHTTDRNYIEQSMQMTLRWAERCRQAHKNVSQLLFGIVQGGFFDDLRRFSVDGTVALDFPGYAIGGLSVGERKDLMYEILSSTAPLLPEEKPRYLMGVGTPEDLVFGVSCGIDMFDCVIPTRSGRNGQAFVENGTINLKNAQYQLDKNPIDEACSCYCCSNYSRGYLSHLVRSNEILASMLITLHNIYFYISLMKKIRLLIKRGEFKAFAEKFVG